MKTNQYLQPLDAPVSRPSDFQSASHIDLKFDIPAGKINYTHISIPSRAYAAIVSLSGEVGTFKDIQVAINYVNNLGGGTVFIKNGTYIVNNDISIPSNVNLLGESSAVVIDFNNQPYQINVIGELIYSAGYISVNNNSTIVTGYSTIWDSTLEGMYIQIRGQFYLISHVDSTTRLTIEVGFSGDNITNEPYIIVNPVTGVTISNMTIQNSTHADGSVFFNYSSGITINSFVLVNSTIGLKCTYSDLPIIDSWNMYYCGQSLLVNYVANIGITASTVFNTLSGTGISISNCNTLSLFNFSVFNSTGYGIYLNNVYNFAILNFSIISNTGVSLYMSNSYDGQIIGGNFMNNTTDAISLTSGNGRLIFSSLLIRNNGGYGINITNNQNNENLIVGNIFKSNTSGAVNDSGTSTKIKSNIGQADN